jgi:hypothetical protein
VRKARRQHARLAGSRWRSARNGALGRAAGSCGLAVSSAGHAATIITYRPYRSCVLPSLDFSGQWPRYKVFPKLRTPPETRHNLENHCANCLLREAGCFVLLFCLAFTVSSRRGGKRGEEEATTRRGAVSMTHWPKQRGVLWAHARIYFVLVGPPLLHSDSAQPCTTSHSLQVGLFPVVLRTHLCNISSTISSELHTHSSSP